MSNRVHGITIQLSPHNGERLESGQYYMVEERDDIGNRWLTGWKSLQDVRREVRRAEKRNLQASIYIAEEAGPRIES